MAQHFLLSKAARTLNLSKVARMSDEEAWSTFKAIRWEATEGAPLCPRWGCLKHSFIATRNLSAVTAVLSLYELSPSTQTRFPAYAHLNWLFAYGEMFTLAQQALEDACKPLTTREIALAIIRAKRWDERDMMLRKAVAYRLVQSLTRALSHGRIASDGKYRGI